MRKRSNFIVIHRCHFYPSFYHWSSSSSSSSRSSSHRRNGDVDFSDFGFLSNRRNCSRRSTRALIWITIKCSPNSVYQQQTKAVRKKHISVLFRGKSGKYSVNIIYVLYIELMHTNQSGRRWWKQKTIVICFYTIDTHSINRGRKMVAEARYDASLELSRMTLFTALFLFGTFVQWKRHTGWKHMPFKWNSAYFFLFDFSSLLLLRFLGERKSICYHLNTQIYSLLFSFYRTLHM